jgi:hypothetical protein
VHRPPTARPDADEPCPLGFGRRGVAARDVRRGALQVLAEGFTTDGGIMSPGAIAADEAQWPPAADPAEPFEVLGEVARGRSVSRRRVPELVPGEVVRGTPRGRGHV